MAAALTLPKYFSYRKWPVKVVPTPDGGMAAWGISDRTGAWEPVNQHIEDMVFDVGGESTVLTADEFVLLVERRRGEYLAGNGPVFALYETVNGIEEQARAEGRALSPAELALVNGIRRKTYVMFERLLQEQGDPAADPSLVG